MKTAASIVVLGQKELETTAAMTLDDSLRQVPGFSLFRRSGSRTANPTSQGVSLRGLGASGARPSSCAGRRHSVKRPFRWVGLLGSRGLESLSPKLKCFAAQLLNSMAAPRWRSGQHSHENTKARIHSCLKPLTERLNTQRVCLSQREEG